MYQWQIPPFSGFSRSASLQTRYRANASGLRTYSNLQARSYSCCRSLIALSSVMGSPFSIGTEAILRHLMAMAHNIVTMLKNDSMLTAFTTHHFHCIHSWCSCNTWQNNIIIEILFRGHVHHCGTEFHNQPHGIDKTFSPFGSLHSNSSAGELLSSPNNWAVSEIMSVSCRIFSSPCRSVHTRF